MPGNRRIVFVGCVVAAALNWGCGRAPLPPVKQMQGGAGRSNFFLWEARNLYTRKTVTLDSVHVPSGMESPLCVAPQGYVLALHDGSVAGIVNDSLAWVAGCGITGDTSAVFGVCVDSSGNVYGTNRRSVFALSATGAPRWRVSLPVVDSVTSLTSAPLYLGRSLFVCSDDGVIVKIDPEAGRVVAVVRPGIPCAPQLAATESGDVVSVLTHGRFQRSDSIVVWSQELTRRASWELTGVRIVQGPVVTGNEITVAGVTDSDGTRRGVVCRFDAAGGLLWRRNVNVLPSGLAVDDAGNTYVNGSLFAAASTQAQLVQLDRTGAQRWYVTIEGVFPWSPAVTKRYVYVVAAYPGGRALYQYSRDGRVEEVEAIPGEPTAPVVDVLGRVVCGDVARAALYVMESDAVGKLR